MITDPSFSKRAWVPLIASTVLVIVAGCATTGSSPYNPVYDPDIRLSHTWMGQPIGAVVAAFGEPNLASAPGRQIWWLAEGPEEPACGMHFWIGTEGLIAGTQVAGECPELAELKAMGWIDPLTTDGLYVQYERFYQVYRVGTEPQRRAVAVGQPFLEIWFLGGFHRDRPDEVARGITLSLEGAGARGDPGDVLEIPVTEAMRAEARILVDDDDAFSLTAVETFPLRGLAGLEDFLFLSIPTPVAHRLLRAGTIELRLPSGFELELPPEQVRQVRQALLLLLDPDRIRASADPAE